MIPQRAHACLSFLFFRLLRSSDQADSTPRLPRRPYAFQVPRSVSAGIISSACRDSQVGCDLAEEQAR